MKNIIIKECPDYILAENIETPVALSPNVYLDRLVHLRQRIIDLNLDYVVIYGDREHFANIEYFTRYDCRFEEALFVFGADGSRSIVVGNEGEALCGYIPYEIQVIRYRDFSLQGQPREGSPLITEVFTLLGIQAGMRIGLAGYKYYADKSWFDVPEYLVRTLRETIGYENLINFTEELTGLPYGLRMTIQNPEEIAVINYQIAKVANVMRRLLKAAKPGMTEEELSCYGRIDFAPQQTHSMINFGAESISIGIKSPSPFVRLVYGGPMSIAYSQRGSLMCRAAFAADSLQTVAPELRDCLETHITPYWSAVALWYEKLGIGCVGGELYDQIHNIIGRPSFGFNLNPGHYIGGDEWVNTEFLHGSKIAVHNGSHIQCDIIAASSNPVLNAICEDTVVVADSGLQAELKAAYPELFQKIEMRRTFMQESLGIDIHPDILPMNEMNAVMFPFMMNTKLMFAME